MPRLYPGHGPWISSRGLRTTRIPKPVDRAPRADPARPRPSPRSTPVPAVLDRLADDVAGEEWPANEAQRADVRHLLPRRGAVLDVIRDGRQVVAEVRAAFDLPGGGRLADEELHLWTFDADGRVARFRHYCDTAKHIRADRGEDTTVETANSGR